MELSDGRVAVTGYALQTCSLENVDVSTPVLNELLPLQFSSSCGNGHPFRPKQFAQGFLRDVDRGRLGEVLCMQEPAGKTL